MRLCLSIQTSLPPTTGGSENLDFTLSHPVHIGHKIQSWWLFSRQDHLMGNIRPLVFLRVNIFVVLATVFQLGWGVRWQWWLSWMVLVRMELMAMWNCWWIWTQVGSSHYVLLTPPPQPLGDPLQLFYFPLRLSMTVWCQILEMCPPVPTYHLS